MTKQTIPQSNNIKYFKLLSKKQHYPPQTIKLRMQPHIFKSPPYLKINTPQQLV